MRKRKKPHILLCQGHRGIRWAYFPAWHIAYNEGINAMANGFCVRLNHRQFGENPF